MEFQTWYMLSHFSHVWLFATLWTAAGQAPLCPWDSPGKNTEVGSHVLLQGIFPTQGLSLHLQCLLHWQAGSFFTTGTAWEALNHGQDLLTGRLFENGWEYFWFS